jgi:hypothetical protein
VGKTGFNTFYQLGDSGWLVPGGWEITFNDKFFRHKSAATVK